MSSSTSSNSLTRSLKVGVGGGRVGEWLVRQMVSALEEMSPDRVVQHAIQWKERGAMLEVQDQLWSVGDEGIWVLGSGKAALPMARAAVDSLGDSVKGGLVITPAGEELDVEAIGPVSVRYGSHPLPEEANRKATAEMIDHCVRIPKGALVLYLLSGGSSALLCAPLEGISVSELRAVHQSLLRSGATIHEMNLVRKALSKIKAGQLLPHLAHTRLFDLVISDVPGDSLSVIGSAPTTACPIETHRAIALLRDRGIWDELPPSVQRALERSHSERGAEWFVSSGPEEHEQILVASASTLAARVGDHLERVWPESLEPLQVRAAPGAYDEPIEEVARTMSTQIQEAMSGPLPAVLLWYGESTVHVTGSGTGGRNQELALRVAMEMDRSGSNAQRPWTFVSLATDGVDGPTDSAGAVAHERTVALARDRDISLNDVLEENDAWHALEGLEAHLRTGSTGHNLMDLQVALIGVPQEQEIV